MFENWPLAFGHGLKKNDPKLVRILTLSYADISNSTNQVGVEMAWCKKLTYTFFGNRNMVLVGTNNNLLRDFFQWLFQKERCIKVKTLEFQCKFSSLPRKNYIYPSKSNSNVILWLSFLWKPPFPSQHPLAM